jgi:hypothetical protein
VFNFTLLLGNLTSRRTRFLKFFKGLKKKLQFGRQNFVTITNLKSPLDFCATVRASSSLRLVRMPLQPAGRQGIQAWSGRRRRPGATSRSRVPPFNRASNNVDQDRDPPQADAQRESNGEPPRNDAHRGPGFAFRLRPLRSRKEVTSSFCDGGKWPNMKPPIRRRRIDLVMVLTSKTC